MKSFGKTSSRFGKIVDASCPRAFRSKELRAGSTMESVSMIAHNHDIVRSKSHGDFLTGPKKRFSFGVHRIGFKRSRRQPNFVFDKRPLVC